MGRGVVDPPDDFRASNPPSNPELLQWLTDRLIESGYSTRALTREILSSDTFARRCASQVSSSESLDAAPVFAGYPLRRMKAEVLFDAIQDATGVQKSRSGGGDLPPTTRAVRLAKVPRDGFLKTFGKPDRLLSCECERSDDLSLSQSLQLLNGPDVRQMIAARPNRLDALVASSDDPDELVDSLYLGTLTRYPTAEEAAAMTEHIAAAASRREAAEDILWALINSNEFSWIR